MIKCSHYLQHLVHVHHLDGTAAASRGHLSVVSGDVCAVVQERGPEDAHGARSQPNAAPAAGGMLPHLVRVCTQAAIGTPLCLKPGPPAFGSRLCELEGGEVDSQLWHGCK